MMNVPRPRSFGLLGRFAIASALSIAVLALGLVLYLRHEARERGLEQAIETAEVVSQLGYDRDIVGGRAERFDDVRFEAFRSALAEETTITGFVLWNQRGGPFYASDSRLTADERATEGPLSTALSQRTLTWRRLSSASNKRDRRAAPKF